MTRVRQVFKIVGICFAFAVCVAAFYELYVYSFNMVLSNDLMGIVCGCISLILLSIIVLPTAIATGRFLNRNNNDDKNKDL